MPYPCHSSATTTANSATRFVSVGEYLATPICRARYSARRTWLFGLLGGIAAGRLFHRYLLDPTDRTIWLLMFLVGVPALLGALYATFERPEDQTDEVDEVDHTHSQ